MPRVPLITRKDQVPEAHHGIVDGIVGSRGALGGPFVAFMHSPEMAARVAHLGTLVRFEGSLDFRVRVLAASLGRGRGKAAVQRAGGERQRGGREPAQEASRV